MRCSGWLGAVCGACCGQLGQGQTTVVGVVGVSMLLSGVALNLNIGGEETGPTAVTIAIAAPEGAAVSGYDQTTLTARR